MSNIIIAVPEIAVLRLEVWEWDVDYDDFVGQACIPMMEMQFGIRSVALHSKKGLLQSSKLLCHFQLETLEGASTSKG